MKLLHVIIVLICISRFSSMKLDWGFAHCLFSYTVCPFLDTLVSFPVSIKEMAAKTKDKKKNGKGGRLRKKFQVPDSDSDETSARAGETSNEDSVEILNNGNEHKIAKVLSSESPLPSRVTRSKARSSTLENGEPNAKCERTSDGRTHTHKTLDKRQVSFTHYRPSFNLL